MRVSREEFLQCLESVQAGLAPREIMEQSTCLIFKTGSVYSYNGEVFCQAKSKLSKDITGAVKATPLLETIRKLLEDEVEIEQKEGELVISGKRKQAGIRMEKDILLTVDEVEKPTSWHKLHEDFNDAIALVQGCAGRDETQFALTCIHLHPKWIEACDRYQITRYRMPTGVSDKTLVRKDSIKHIVALGVTEFSETASWLHFRNDRVQLSCRRFLEDYPDLKPYLDVQGQQAKLPKGLQEAVERADVFSQENADYNFVGVELSPGWLKLRGEGASGWYTEKKKIDYAGRTFSFMISPKILSELAKKYNTCEVSEDKLKVNGGKWKYVTVLNRAEENGHAKEEE